MNDKKKSEPKKSRSKKSAKRKPTPAKEVTFLQGPHEMTVYLVGTGKNARLHVDDGGKQNEIDPNNLAQEISWVLDDKTLPQASFLLPEQGASLWQSGNPAGVFRDLSLTDSGRRLSVMDFHPPNASPRHWTYLLAVSVQGQVYTTQGKASWFKQPAAGRPGGPDPIIINK